MARHIVGSILNDLEIVGINNNFLELYNDLGTATGTKQKLEQFLNGTGVVTNTMLADESVDGNKIAQASIFSPHLRLGAVGERELATGGVTSSKIRNDAVNETKIQNGAVTRSKIVNDSIDGTKVADASIFSNHMRLGAIGERELATGGITSEKIRNGEVTNEKLAEVPFKRNIIPTNTALSTVIENGRYLGLSGNIYPERPDDLMGASFILDVQTYNDNHNFIIQKIIETRNPSNSLVRYIQRGTLIGDWVKDLSLIPQIQRRVIPEGATTSFMTGNGQYLGISGYGYADIPTEVNDRSFMLDVRTFNDNELFVIQTLTVTSNIDVTYKRYIRDGGASPFVSEWYKDYSLIKPNQPSNPTGHPLEGKNIVCFGDSLTEFGDYTGKIQAATGAKVTNVGFGGCRMAKSPEGSLRYPYNEMSMVGISNTIKTGDFTALDAAAADLRDNHNDDNTAAVQRLKDTDFNTVDYITIFYGTNDHNGEIPLGANDSIDEFEFNGAINLSIENILTTYPHIRVLLLTPTWRGRRNVGDGQESDSNPNPSGVYLIEYVEAIENRANDHKLISYNMYNNSGINKYTSEHYQTDGLHLTDKGDEVVSRILSHQLSGI